MNSKRSIAVITTMLRSGGELRCVSADSDLFGSFLYRSGKREFEVLECVNVDD